MTVTSKVLVVLFAAISVIAFTSFASAQMSAKRAAAMERCNKIAVAIYTTMDIDQDMDRHMMYMDCMTQAHEIP